MTTIEADLSGITNYVAAVQGIVAAAESIVYKDDFLFDTMDDIGDKFMKDSIANRHNLAHVFEWPDKQGQEPPPIPLFKIVRIDSGVMKTMTFDFLPSTKNVPLPDPARYGFKPEKLKYLRRHKFKMKALVMETQSAVTITPKKSKRGLFIPDASAARGYYMTKKPTVINPGGRGATGSFTEWWNAWFEARAVEIVDSKIHLKEETFAANGSKVIRNLTTGKFSSRKNIVSSANRRVAELEFLMLEKRSKKK